MESDPFYQVLEDAKEQLEQLLQHLENSSVVQYSEIQEIINEVEETIQDLDSSVTILSREENSDENEISNRRLRIQSLRDQLAIVKKKAEKGQALNSSTDFLTTEESAAGGIDSIGALQEQMLREQDSHLDNIHHTMQNLHAQATTMGQELHDQSAIMQDLEGGIDTVMSKLSRGRRKLEWIYEQNSERYNDCCVGLLIVILIVLVILSFAV
ncbi:Tlg1p Ecym_4525 [Eremothecium cymbalariae DBVPG|uniref:t-SNARE affecting a late Golgi compartment protein 1 n=1 Tax=Eremothecium cymbalariae (strain CBS 270.75 / DBVPG 7215 / KCTC 17166 / NRRL Y-17582) TaxID=931890 RepID=G8JU59_ERECY|nr:hypothetical protein Ecym_4525 [Eremothecium cymbalariae DBVPG\